MRITHLLIAILLISFLSACSQQGSETNANQEKGDTAHVKEENFTGKKVNEFDLTAMETTWKLTAENTINAWTYNDTVPGEQLRVKEGEVVKVNLTNELQEPVSIHWHGIPVPNTEDGIPGITQDAVLPGESYTYEFVANDPGTYWYHSHQNGVDQLDKGLYGTIIVEPTDPKEEADIDRDYTLVLDEWESGNYQVENTDNTDHDNMDMNNKSGMMDGKGMGHDMSSYDIFTINGRSYENSKPLKVRKGDLVKLRFINAGYMVHQIHIPIDYKITHVDGQKVNKPQSVNKSLFEIAPGERIDVEFTADGSSNFTIDRHGEAEASQAMKIDVVYEDRNVQDNKHETTTNTVDITQLGKQRESQFSINDNFDVEYEMDLATQMNMDAEMGMVWTINGKTFPDVSPLKVNKGDKVKVTLTNNSMDKATHPMHLHGHFFQVLSKNGEPLSHSPIMKDTLNVKPGETYEVAFLADNPGNWLFHCHDLHHASNGMVSMVNYNNFKAFYQDNGNVDNQPE
ncbi:multicopper oxidase family protein [Virgibacillus sp. AGTR]|uniref:multicopper oxidase family protein n=1 Tax=Virgibacillus sp. AGTR TaxID=2812055 RepID=UPI001963DE8D|nr:multicopper oxidase family protein [Virgibacillus sp. AGTR]MCC2249344.1 multicopper oxidase family protein [Virgibacillus sp. AGTR]QRZ18854.1 multicopper oxidase family protein [Virgibacillus sp. AGTR]